MSVKIHFLLLFKMYYFKQMLFAQENPKKKMASEFPHFIKQHNLFSRYFSKYETS